MGAEGQTYMCFLPGASHSDSTQAWNLRNEHDHDLKDFLTAEKVKCIVNLARQLRVLDAMTTLRKKLKNELRASEKTYQWEVGEIDKIIYKIHRWHNGRTNELESLHLLKSSKEQNV